MKPQFNFTRTIKVLLADGTEALKTTGTRHKVEEMSEYLRVDRITYEDSNVYIHCQA